MACDCVKNWNKSLKEKINETARVNVDIFSGRVVVNGIYHKQKKNGSYASKWEEVGLWPKFCPFCGKAYEETKKGGE